MKRIVSIGLAVVAFAAAPSIAVAGNGDGSTKSRISAAKQQKPQVRLSPQFAYSESGTQVWRAGNHLMY